MRVTGRQADSEREREDGVEGWGWGGAETDRQTDTDRHRHRERQTERDRERQKQRQVQLQLLKRPVQSKSEVSSFATLNVYRCRGSFVAAKLQSTSRDFVMGA